MGLGDNILINDFMFCLEHGLEVCYRCCCDHRMCNNIQVEDELADESPEFDVGERPPIDAYALGAARAPNTEESYQCYRHEEIDCGTCFDWVRMIKEEASEVEGRAKWLKKRSKAMDKMGL